jgi:phosphoribosyl 1,2-cyclic phosphate phosphodiesterase
MAFRISMGGRSMVYAPDMGGAPDSKLARGADLLVMDGTTYEGALSGHLSMVEGVDIARRLRAGRTLFTHVGHRAGRHADIEGRLPDGFSIAYDGLELDA